MGGCGRREEPGVEFCSELAASSRPGVCPPRCCDCRTCCDCQSCCECRMPCSCKDTQALFNQSTRAQERLWRWGAGSCASGMCSRSI